tara:strand:- start:2051 stop:2869 length:819 start_codon:yes stop_codon:yes gene_type:complete
MRNRITLFLFLVMSFVVCSQDLTNNQKLWLSNYTFVKLNSRFSLDNFYVMSYDLHKNNRFGFAQTDLGFNYHLNKKLRFFMAYSNSQFRFLNSYYNRYDREPNSLGYMTFHRFGLGTQYIYKINRNFRVINRVVAQFYTPKLQKYKYRHMHVFTINYRHRKLPFRIRPFAQSFLYYYSGGFDYEYKNETSEVESAPPNGLHRYRIRFGFSFKPLPKVKLLTLKAYYGFQQEFNTPWGNDLNVERIGNYTGNVYTDMKFNNYIIWGVQFNLIL